MALLFFDGFDQYVTGTDLTKYGGWFIQAGATVQPINRIGTGNSMFFSSSNNYINKVIPNQSGKIMYAGFSIMFLNVTYNNPIIGFHISTIGSSQVFLSLDVGTGVLSVRSGTNAILARGTKTINANTWYYIEVKCLVANSGGIFDVKIDGITDIVYSGDTQQQSTDGVSVIRFGYQLSTDPQSYYIDDFYLCNEDGTFNNTYLGEQRCEIIQPNSDSSVTWTHNTGATNYEAIDDILGTPDDDTTYVYAPTPGLKDEYGLSDLTDVNTTAGVKLITRVEKDDLNTLTFKHGIKSGVVDQQIEYSLSIGYANFMDIFETADGVGTPFTEATINSLLSTIEAV